MGVPVYDIGLGAWKATGIDYSIPTSDSCYVCRSYWEIDDFASRVSLPSIEKLSIRPGVPPKIKNMPDGLIDGQELLRSMIEMDIQVNGSVANNNANILNVDNSSKGMFQRLAGEEKMNSESYKTAKKNFPQLDQIVSGGAKIPNEPLDIARYKKLHEDWPKEMMAWNQRNEKGEEAIKGFAKVLWSAFKAARKGLVDAESDNVLKARLIFTWLATSFSYDSGLAARNDGDWPLIKNFATGKAICSGFAGLFVLMFNAIVKAEESQAYPLTGFCRYLGGNPPPDKYDTGHAWAAFPLEPKEGDYQLLDVTWARKDFSNGTKDVKHVQWWSKPNASFNWSHIYNADYHKYWNPTTVPPYSTTGNGSGSFPNRWNRAQPVFVSEQYEFLHFIDVDSLSEKDLVIGEKNGKIVVNFNNPCQHERKLKPPPFYLVAASKAEDPQFAKPRATFESRTNGICSAAFLVQVLTNMAYIAICVQEGREYRPVVIWLRVGQDIPKKYRDIPKKRREN